MKIRPMGAELLHAGELKDRRTDRHTEGKRDVTMLIVAFGNFAKAAYNTMWC